MKYVREDAYRCGTSFLLLNLGAGDLFLDNIFPVVYDV